MPAAKKTATKATSAAVKTVSTDDRDGVPYLDPELEKARDEERKADAALGWKDTAGGLNVSDAEPTIDPELVKAREAELKAEKNRKTF